MKRIEIFTDGACLGNPGAGGWAAILRYKDTEKELSGGEKETTNNRMELTAVIMALEALKESVAQAISEFFPSKDIKRSDIFHGFVAAISIRIEEPIFVDAMRNELGSNTITSAPDSMTIMDFVASFVKKTLSEIFVSQKTK